MSTPRIPVTDAFDESEQFQSLEVKLTPEQIEWLRTTAEKRDLSVDHVLRSVLISQMRQDSQQQKADTVFPSVSGDGAPKSTGDGAASDAEAEAEEAGGESEDPPSIMQSLRSASERLQDLTEEDDSEASTPSDTLSRLQARRNRAGAEEEQSEEDSVLTDDSGTSMFEMMDE